MTPTLIKPHQVEGMPALKRKVDFLCIVLIIGAAFCLFKFLHNITGKN